MFKSYKKVHQLILSPVWVILVVCVFCLNESIKGQTVQEPFLEKAENAKSQGNYQEAILEYEKLIEQNPQNPEYLFQKAMCYYRLGDYNTSIRLSNSLVWEKGINKAPGFGENYYWAAKHYANTNEKVWVLIYAEIFLNIERSTDRFNEISKLLYDTYVEVLYENGGDYEIYLPRSAPNNFYDIYRAIIRQILEEGKLLQPVVVNGAVSESHLGGISQARERFIEIWNESYSTAVSCDLFVYHNDMMRRGLFDSYTHWLMINAKPKYFMSWQKLNNMSYQKFINWFITNKMTIDQNNYIVRMQYEAN